MIDEYNIRQAIIKERKEEKMRNTIWDIALGIILGTALGLVGAAIIASFAYRPVTTHTTSNPAYSVQIDGDTVYYTYIPALEEK